MDKKPFDIIPASVENTFVYLFSYAGSDTDETADKSAYNTELAKHFLYSSPAVANNGICVTDTSLTISDDGGTARTVKLSAVTDLTGTAMQHIPVYYKGWAVPMSDYSSYAPATDGKITFISNTKTKYSSTTGTDWKVYYSDHILGSLVSIDAGGISLPIEGNAFKAAGIVEPVTRLYRRGTPEGTGSITVAYSMSSILWATGSPRGFPGEDLYRRIYGDNWSHSNAGFLGTNRNQLSFNTNPFGIAIVFYSGKPSAATHTSYLVWGSMLNIYHCMITNISAPQNLTNDSTDPVFLTVEFKSRYPIPEFSTLLT